MLRQVVDMRTKLMGVDDKQVILRTYELEGLLMSLRIYRKAERLYQNVLDRRAAVWD